MRGGHDDARGDDDAKGDDDAREDDDARRHDDARGLNDTTGQSRLPWVFFFLFGAELGSAPLFFICS